MTTLLYASAVTTGVGVVFQLIYAVTIIFREIRRTTRE